SDLHGADRAVSVTIVQTADLHFGSAADIRQVEALERLVPDLRPDAIVVAGDLSLRARHGEFQRARALVMRLGETAPVLVIPGNHDVRWWWRPLLPFGTRACYGKYVAYFGDNLTPTIEVPGAVFASVLTAHGVAWGSLTFRPRDIAVKGHLPKGEIERATKVFRGAAPGVLRVLVAHHNVLRGAISQRMGLARWKQAQRRIMASGADLVLCAHDHQEGADTLPNGTIVATASTLSTRPRGGRPSSFNVVIADEDSVQITFFRWEAERGRFRASDTHAFTRPRRALVAEPAVATG
ncbi:MAG: metallophosphoesterase family protein, partial [Gemmatimonadales bacterium]